jgi:hypothetical protein
MIPTVIRVRNHASKSSCFRCSEQALVFGRSLLPMATHPPTRLSPCNVALQIRPCLVARFSQAEGVRALKVVWTEVDHFDH